MAGAEGPHESSRLMPVMLCRAGCAAFDRGKMRGSGRIRRFVATRDRETQEKHKPGRNGLLLDRLKSGRFPELGQYRCPIFPAGLRAPGSQGRWLVACTTAKRDTKRAAIRAVRAHAG
ncbi:hypothetical protein Maq22A_c22725 [Methylobacterium aquaticum]|uniref:Uncharacterized protein n=1 Tax=Methylobacterium aquaticum TaxID=270351 RepID=A0A0C6FK96_9HYPH|nr:hypothetical protein Maq22A_c22725 [Methylobacterium aquaticum]